MAQITLFRLKWDNITKLSLVYFFSAFYFYLPFITLYYQSRGLSLLQITSLQSIIIGITFFANIPTGIFADKFGKKSAITVSIGLQLLGELLFYFARSYPQFILIAVIAGIGFSFTIGAVSALIYETLKAEGREAEMSRATGGRMATESAARILGPFLGGLILVSFTIGHFMLLIICTIITVFISFLLTFTLSEPENIKTGTTGKSSFRLFKDGLILLRDHSSLRRIVLLSLFTNPLIAYLFILYQPYFLKAGVPQIFYGSALSLGAVFGLLGNKFAYFFEKHFGVNRAIFIVTVIPGILYFLMPVLYNPLISFILVSLLYLPLGIQDPLFTDYQNRHIESVNRATVLSLISMLNNIYIAVMGLVLGFLADKSLNTSFMLIGLVILLSSFLFRIDKTHLVRTGIKISNLQAS